MKSPRFSSRTSGDLTADRRYAYGDDAFRDGDYIAARDLFAQTLECAPDWPPAFLALGKAHLALDEQEPALAAFEGALARDPDDILGAGLYLARLKQGQVKAQTMSDPYIAALFDEYAPRFDHHLTTGLAYQAPALLRNSLLEAGFHHAHHALDLGCGTGLMAAAMAGTIDHCVGVDLSAGMLAQAQATGLYDTLICASLLEHLAQPLEHRFDLVLAADVFCYIGELAPVFCALHPVMTTGGFFAFTIQSHAGEGVVLGEDFRMHHAPALIERELIFAGFSLLLNHPVIARVDGGKPVQGHLFCAIKP